VALHVPRYGIPHATLDADGEQPFLAGLVTLTIRDLVFACTLVDTFSRKGMTWARIVGGRAGWRKEAPPDGGKRNDAGVKLSTVATNLAAAVGELIEVPASVDRRCGSPVARLGGLASGALSALCSSPASSPPVPWHVSPAGVTILGERNGVPVTLEPLDAPVGPTYSFGDEKGLLRLLPGNTIGGRPIDVLRIIANADKIRAEVIVS
jgi:hypothetical protein